MAWPPCLSMPHGPCLSAAASFAGRRLAPNLQGAVHPTTTLVCWQVRRPPPQRPERLQSFGTITLVLAMPLQLAPSTNQVQLTPHARLAHPSRSLTPGCTPWVAGAHRTLRWNLISMAVKRQSLAVAWQLCGARAARHAHASVCGKAREGPRPRSGRRLVVEPADHRCLAGPPGPTAELGGLWSAWISSRVGV